MTEPTPPIPGDDDATQAQLSALAAVLRHEPIMRARCATTADEAALDELLDRVRVLAWRVLAYRLERYRAGSVHVLAQTHGVLAQMRRELALAQSLDDAMHAGRSIVGFVARWLTC